MKTLVTLFAVTLIAFTARASDPIPRIAMPVGLGYATDAKGQRHRNAFCLRDAVFAPSPQFPTRMDSPRRYTPVGMPEIRANLVGLCRLQVNLNTGRVTKVSMVKSTGLPDVDSISVNAFQCWMFKPGKWREVILPIAVRTKWVGIISG
jgi:hypothetical protein